MSLPEPITRKEQYYDGIAKGNASKLPEPITREEQYLEYIAKNGGGGGGGTTDYEALDNKPSVNSVELSGNKTLDDLDIQGKLTFDNEPTEDSQNPVKSGGVYEALESLNEAISRKPDEYADLTDKPSINSVELSGNKTASDLGLQAELDGAQTVEGNPITVADAEPMNAESVVVELEPKQDLHGYDAPWVGGSGKNKIDVANVSMQSAGFFINKVLNLSANTYTLSFDCTVSENAQVQIDLKSGETSIATKTISINAGTSRAVATLTTSTDTNVITAYISTSATIENIQLEVGSTATTFAPYSNICPITGYSEVNVERVGKNLFEVTATTQTINGVTFTVNSDGTVIANGTATAEADFLMSASNIQGSYIVNGCPIGGSTSTYYLGIETTVSSWNNRDFGNGVTINDDTIIRAAIVIAGGYTANNLIFKPMIRLATESDPTFEPYQGDTYTVSLGGTKYGGTLDVTEGGYSDEWGYIEGDSLQDFLNAGYTTTQLGSGVLLCSAWSHAIPAPSGVTPKTMLRCNNLDNVDPETQWSGNISGVCINNQGTIGFTVKDITTQEELDTWLQNNPLQIAFRNGTRKESTTPTDIPLLENTNNISTDGTNIELKYQPNNVIGEAKAYTDEKCAEVLPPLPTTDGTYHLSCEVTSGVGVLSWVSDS